MKIVLDIFGGDNSPYAPIDGAVDFLKDIRDDSVTVVLSGDEKLISDYLSQKQINDPRIEILHAPDEVTCHDEPTAVVRQKPESSMVRGIKAVAQGEADGLVSAGSTGALFAGSLSRIKRIPGIIRPCLPTEAPNLAGGYTVLCDSGANADCTPEFLLQFALLGSCYVRAMYGKEHPRVGLISNGTEDEKGNALTRDAHALLRQAQNINFVGNVEARELFTGDTDVFVCDGFTGNVVLKTIEGSIKVFGGMLKQEIMSSLISKLGGLLIKKSITNLKKRFDYREVGGAPLLGIRSCVIKAHGSSNARAFCMALHQAKKYIEHDVTGAISREISSLNTDDITE